jgi:response regulator RpfG family c-di-GMP phosphodiesterase
MTCVLIADDNHQAAEMLRATLEDAGYEVLTAYSGLAAVASGFPVLRKPFVHEALVETLNRLLPKK